MQRTIDIDFPTVTHVRHTSGHTLWLRFSDGVEGHIDMSDWLDGPAFARLRTFMRSTVSSWLPSTSGLAP